MIDEQEQENEQEIPAIEQQVAKTSEDEEDHVPEQHKNDDCPAKNEPQLDNNEPELDESGTNTENDTKIPNKAGVSDVSSEITGVADPIGMTHTNEKDAAHGARVRDGLRPRRERRFGGHECAPM